MVVRGRLSSTWNRHDRTEIGVILGVIALMHLIGFATLTVLIAPRHFHAGSQIFGVGLGATAYLFGLRHAFDADHIAAIDNTTRKLMVTMRAAQQLQLAAGPASRTLSGSGSRWAIPPSCW
jgi:high-affinity nickel permease